MKPTSQEIENMISAMLDESAAAVKAVETGILKPEDAATALTWTLIRLTALMTAALTDFAGNADRPRLIVPRAH